MKIEFTLNHQQVSIDAPPDITLLALLRDHLNLTGTKEGCEVGECGACTVILDGQAVNSCMVLAPQVAGRDVITIEGIRGPDGGPNDLQENFIEFGAVQCGFCIPGMVLSGEALLMQNPRPTRQEIRQALSGNLCRCTGYQHIVDAIEATALNRANGAGTSKYQGINRMSELKYVGKPARRVDALEKVMGTAKYVGDYHLPGMLYARALRSEIPHGRITRLDVSPALDVPGVKAVITNEDFADRGMFGFPVLDQYMLAYEKVRFVGTQLQPWPRKRRKPLWPGSTRSSARSTPCPASSTWITPWTPTHPRLAPTATTASTPISCTTNTSARQTRKRRCQTARFRLTENTRSALRNTPFWKQRGRWLSPPRREGSPFMFPAKVPLSTRATWPRC